jgi:hypothetical protein
VYHGVLAPNRELWRVRASERGEACPGGWPGETCDAAPLRNVRCVHQQCTADYPSSSERDAGEEEANPS